LTICDATYIVKPLYYARRGGCNDDGDCGRDPDRADRGLGELAVGIRTFWWQDGRLCFGAGAGITWGSDPHGEWAETELKADRLLAVASGLPSTGGQRKLRRYER